MDVFNVKENKYRVANRHSRTLPRRPNSRVDSDGKMAKRVSPIRRHFVKRDNAVECSICLQTFVQAPGGNTSNLAKHLRVHHPREWLFLTEYSSGSGRGIGTMASH